MRSACYVGKGTLEVFDSEPRDPGMGEVAIEVAYTGICGTDLHILHGAMDARVTLPAVLGHEMSGTISSLGEGVTGWSLGDRVTVMPLSWCGHCPRVSSGTSPHLSQPRLSGHRLPGLDAGTLDGLRERARRAARRRSRWRHAALAEPSAVAVHDVRRSGLREGERALVVGGGPIGILIACVARSAGADVLVLEVSETRRAFAETLGLRAVDPAAGDVQALVAELDRRRRRGCLLRGLGCGRRSRDGDRVACGARAHRRGRDPLDAAAARPLPCVLARAHAARRAGLRARRLRAGGGAARRGRDSRRSS